jgi:hypothetical protein
VDNLGAPKVQGVGQENPGVKTVGLTALNVYTKNGKNETDTSTLSKISSETDNGDNWDEWTTVLRKRTRHPKSKKERVAIGNKQPVVNKADPVVEQAKGKLTKEQRDKIFRRYEKLKIKSTTNDTSSEHSKGEGPSRLKGKSIDPRNWGGLQLSGAEIDPEAQRAALRAIRDTKNGEVKKLKPHLDKENPKSGSKKEVPKQKGKGKKLVSEVRPSTQIPQDSYLGAVFAKAREVHKGDDTSPTSESSTSSESSSDSTSSDSNRSPSGSDLSDPSNPSSDSSSGKRRRRARPQRPKRGKKKRPTHKTKAIPPKEYNGKADARAYHRFMKEGMAYLEDAKIQPKRYAYTLSCTLLVEHMIFTRRKC